MSYDEERLLAIINKIETGSANELLSRVSKLIGYGGAVFTPNPTMLSYAMENEQLYSALMSGVCIPDGNGLRSVLRAGGIHTDVFPGVELGEKIISLGVTFGIIGGRVGRAEEAASALCLKYPKSGAVFALDGYSDNKRKLLSLIDITGPEVVLICLGTPRQELLASELSRNFPHVLFLALGGSVDIYSGALRRAPSVFRALSLEWLWRMLREPRRFFGIFRILKFIARSKTVLKKRKWAKTARKHPKKPEIY